MPRSCFQPCVYVVAARDFRVKVGISALLSRRLVQLVASEGEPLAVVRRFDYPAMYLARRVEAAAKLALSLHQIEGEWFRVTRSDAVRAVEDSAARAISPADIASATAPAERIRKAQEEDMALIRAGRRMLGWTQADLAARAGISVATLKNIERGTSDPQIGTLKAIQAALGSAGIVFLQPGDMRTGGKGVRLKD